MGLIYSWLAAANIIAFFMYGIDKLKAKHRRRRIPEATLLGIAAAGGSLGAFAGMQIFRHKTKHLRFQILVPLFLVLHIVALVLAFLYL